MDRGRNVLAAVEKGWRRQRLCETRLDPAILVEMLEELGRGSDQTASSVAKRPETFE